MARTYFCNDTTFYYKKMLRAVVQYCEAVDEMG